MSDTIEYFLYTPYSPSNLSMTFMTTNYHHKLAHHLADTLNDYDALPFYLSCVQKYSEDHITKILNRVMAIPEQKIRRSRAALFTFLIQQAHGGKKSHDTRP